MSGFDTTPKPAFLLAMQNQKWTVAGALSELVDNSFGSGRGDARRAVIIHDSHARLIWVFDSGRGMDAIGRLFQLGNTIGRSPGDIGLYGSGGTMAILWLADRVEVWTLRDGKVSHDLVDWKKQIAAAAFPVVSDEWKRATIGNTPAPLLEAGHGSMIRLRLLKERSFFVANVQRDLASNFAPAIRKGKELVWQSIGKGAGETILADALPSFSDKEKVVSFDIALSVNDELLPVVGRIGVIEDLPQSKSVISVGFGPRTITRTRDCYSSPDGTERFIGTGVAGWLDLGEGWQPYLATTKDALNDQPAWDALMAHVFEQIRPLLSKIDSSEFSAEFDDLAIQLEAALSGSSAMELDVAANWSAGGNEQGDSESRHPIVDPEPHEKPEPADDAGDEAHKKEAAFTRITIIQSSDEELEGVLSRSELIDDELMITVNRDHYVIQRAMHARPIDKMALNLIITREIAVEVSENQKMMKRMFTRPVRERIDALGEKDRPRLIARLLMDRVRKKAA